MEYLAIKKLSVKMFGPFETRFAAELARQVHSHLPAALMQKCYGCRLQSDDDLLHTTCKWDREAIVFVCFKDALGMVEKELVEDRFFYACEPRPAFPPSWYAQLWADPDWLDLVEDKVVRVQDVES